LVSQVYCLAVIYVELENEQAFAEFIDNSIQACKDVNSPKIDLHFFSNLRYQTNVHEASYFMVADNGSGMTEQNMKDFATFARGAEQRGLTLNTRQDIGLFGVGAKNAAFHLGDRLIVLSKAAGDSAVRRLILDRYEILERVNAGLDPYEFLIENSVSNQTLIPKVDIDVANPIMKQRIFEHANNNPENFTIILVKLKSPLTGNAAAVRRHNLRNSNVCDLLFGDDNIMKTVKRLGEIYFFHMNPNPTHSQDAVVVGLFNPQNGIN